jgi:hypothetical protein
MSPSPPSYEETMTPIVGNDVAEELVEPFIDMLRREGLPERPRSVEQSCATLAFRSSSCSVTAGT